MLSMRRPRTLMQLEDYLDIPLSLRLQVTLE